MRVYISGPISGQKDYARKFYEAENAVVAAGHSPINPARIAAYLPKDTTYEEYMELDLKLLGMVDAILMLEGWEKSLGANREYGFALARNLEVWFQIGNIFITRENSYG